MRYLSKNEALTLLRMAEELHKGKRSFPPEIMEKKREIAAATRNAHLFIIRTGQVAEDMIEQVTRLRLELDSLYGSWVESEASGVVG